jgi:uncharacterized protein (TIGR02118 family)
MRRFVGTSFIALATALSACGAPKEAAKPAADTATTAVLPPPAPPRAIATVLYKWPKDTAKFEKYYPTHLKIVTDHQQEIGFTKAELTKFVSSLQGTKPEFYRQAELYFPSMDALKAGIATAGFKAVGDDFKNFVAPDGMLALIAEETGPASEVPCPAVATIIYGTPTSAAAFEEYYPKHLQLVTAEQTAVGFTRADLTKFISNLDGTPPAVYRQAELCFPTMEQLTTGVGSAAFGKIGNDFGNFVTGGLRGLIGVQQ